MCVGGGGGGRRERNNTSHAIIRQPGQSSKYRTRQTEGFARWGSGGEGGWEEGGGAERDIHHTPQYDPNHPENAGEERDYRWGGGRGGGHTYIYYIHITHHNTCGGGGGGGTRER